MYLSRINMQHIQKIYGLGRWVAVPNTTENALLECPTYHLDAVNVYIRCTVFLLEFVCCAISERQEVNSGNLYLPASKTTLANSLLFGTTIDLQTNKAWISFYLCRGKGQAKFKVISVGKSTSNSACLQSAQ